MPSQRDMEGHLSIDHRESPGITPEEAAKVGVNTLPVGRGTHFQSATRNCSQCTKLIVLNPNRTRPRFYCPKCDAYHCDECALLTKITGECRPFKKFVDDFVNWASKYGNSPDAPPRPPSPFDKPKKLILP